MSVRGGCRRKERVKKRPGRKREREMAVGDRGESRSASGKEEAGIDSSQKKTGGRIVVLGKNTSGL